MSDRAERLYLECPCCGDDGAESDDGGEFYDGQPLICGCVGLVSVDSETDPWINTGDEPCACGESRLNMPEDDAKAQEVERLTAENERLSDLLDATETSHGILNQDLLAAEIALAEARAENVIGDGCAECGTKIAGEPMWCRQCAEEVERDKEYICAVCGHEQVAESTKESV